MQQFDPYAPPGAEVEKAVPFPGTQIEKLISGQKTVVNAILAIGSAILFIVVVEVLSPGSAYVGLISPLYLVAFLVIIISAGAIVVGTVRAAKGLGWSSGIRILLAISIPVLMLLPFFIWVAADLQAIKPVPIPLVILVFLLIAINLRVTKVLRANGHKVGFFGVSR